MGTGVVPDVDAYGKYVDYGKMDPFKVMAVKASLRTLGGLGRFGFADVPETQGESCRLIDCGEFYLGLTVEGLGTKNLVADLCRKLGITYYGKIAKDVLAMIFNDLITVGALPLMNGMHLDVGSSDWCLDLERAGDLINGWADACIEAGAMWACGETATLRDILLPGTASISGASIGIIRDKKNLVLSRNLRAGDRIVGFASTGVHANGLTLARKAPDRMPQGYDMVLPGGQTYGEALLEPTHLYVRVVEELQKSGVPIHYLANITGHGLRKFMRPREPFTYRIRYLPQPQPVFAAIQEYGDEKGRISDYDMFSNFNQGTGFGWYGPASAVSDVIAIAYRCGIPAFEMGVVEEGPKQVILEPLGIMYGEDTLNVR